MTRTSFSRRGLMAATAIALPALVLAGCSLTQQQLAAQVVADAQSIKNGLPAFLPILSSVTGVPAATLTTVSADVQTAISDAGQITASISAASAGSLVSEIYSVVSTAAKIAGPFIPGPGGLILNAVLALIPAISSTLGISVGAVGAAPGGLTPDAARAILNNAAATLALQA